MDSALRFHQRRAACDGEQASARYLQSRLRRGELSRFQVTLAAYAGDPVASILSPVPEQRDLLEWASGLAQWRSIPLSALVASTAARLAAGAAALEPPRGAFFDVACELATSGPSGSGALHATQRARSLVARHQAPPDDAFALIARTIYFSEFGDGARRAAAIAIRAAVFSLAALTPDGAADMARRAVEFSSWALDWAAAPSSKALRLDDELRRFVAHVALAPDYRWIWHREEAA